MADRRLERRLSALSEVAFPETPRLVAGVMDGVARHRGPRRRWMTAVAVAGLVIVAVLALPGAREALARLLGIGGVAIEQITDFDLPATSSTDEPLGSPMNLEEAEARIGFAPRIPGTTGLEDPAVYFRPDTANGVVSLVYRNEGEAPGLVITQFQSVGEAAVKQIGDGSSFREVVLDGDTRAFWIEGTHSIVFVDGDGRAIQDSARLVGDTLLWEYDGITFRIESALPLRTVIEIARSME